MQGIIVTREKGKGGQLASEILEEARYYELLAKYEDHVKNGSFMREIEGMELKRLTFKLNK